MFIFITPLTLQHNTRVESKKLFYVGQK